MTFTALSLAALPKRKAPERTWDREAAASLLSIVTGDLIDGSPPTVTDAVEYADEKLARAEANKIKRLLGHVLPDGKIAKTATFGIDVNGDPIVASASAGKFGWAVWIIEAPDTAEAVETLPGKSK